MDSDEDDDFVNNFKKPKKDDGGFATVNFPQGHCMGEIL